MKYFVSPSRPFGTVTFDLQMEKNGVYEVPSRLAYDLYVDAEANPRNHMNYEHIDHAFETGRHVFISNFVELWGEDIADKELFKRRLNGDVKKEIVETFNPPYDEE